MMHLNRAHTAALLGFVPGATVEVLDRDGGIIGSGIVADGVSVTVEVPWDVTPRRWPRRDIRRLRHVVAYSARAVATGAEVEISPRLIANSGMTITVYFAGLGRTWAS